MLDTEHAVMSRPATLPIPKAERMPRLARGPAPPCYPPPGCESGFDVAGDGGAVSAVWPHPLCSMTSVVEFGDKQVGNSMSQVKSEPCDRDEQELQEASTFDGRTAAAGVEAEVVKAEIVKAELP